MNTGPSYPPAQRLSEEFRKLADRLGPDVAIHPRRVPGRMMVDGRALSYVDLHSLYYQVSQIFIERLYDTDLDDAQGVILDCGAHIGLASLFFAHRYPNATIHAFEADPLIAEALRANVETFGCDKVHVHAEAVWTETGLLGFDGLHDDSGHVVASDAVAMKVPTRRLRSFIDGMDVALLKLDIEGAEFPVLDDCDGALDRVRTIIAELHLFGQPDAQLHRLLSVLDRNNFRYALLDLHQALWLPSGGKPPFHCIGTDKYIITVFAWRP